MEYIPTDLLKKNSFTPSQSTSKVFYDLDYDGAFPMGNYYLNTFGRIPQNYLHNDKLRPTFVKNIIKAGFELIWSSRTVDKGQDHPLNLVYNKEDAFIKVTYQYIDNDADDKSITDGITLDIFYSDISLIEPIIKKMPRYRFKVEYGGNISLIKSATNGLTTITYPIRQNDLNVELNYGKKFMPVYNKIIEKLNMDRGKGLVLLHGIPGSGKTSFIRHLACQVKKEVLFLPPSLAHQISDPSFITFLMSHSNSIVVIEDAEKVILDRETGSGNDQGVSNILNLTDGILSDCLSIQIIATFNTSRDKIDSALLRKGRLLSEWKFDQLSADDSNALLKHLGKDFITNVPMTLTDIYNIDEDNMRVQEERRVIGFSNR